MGLGIGVGDPAGQLARVHVARAAHGKHRARIVAGLFFQQVKADGAPIQARRRAGFQPPTGKASSRRRAPRVNAAGRQRAHRCNFPGRYESLPDKNVPAVSTTERARKDAGLR